MREVVDSITQVVLLTSFAWLVVMVGTGAALAHRLGWRAGYGALLGLVPVPFAGWLIVYAYTRRNELSRHVPFNPDPLSDVDPDGRGSPRPGPSVDDWSRP